MARIVFGSYFVRYPLAGMMSHVLQYLLGLRALGHDVVFVERAAYPDACYDPVRRVMTDDGELGFRVARRVLHSHGLSGRICFVDHGGRYWGLTRSEVEEAFDGAVFMDMGTHGAWMEEAAQSAVRMLIDGEPGYNQIRMEQGEGLASVRSAFDLFFTNGRNIGTPASDAPTAGVTWRHLFHPVLPELFASSPPPPDAPFTTVMNWKAHSSLEFEGRTFGQKDVAFERFVGLPGETDIPLEVSVAGTDAPRARLEENGWRVRDAHRTTRTFGAFSDYLRSSRGEFSVCKEVFVKLNTGWFSDRSAAYLAAGRPVVMQETGFSDHLPVGEGLFAVRTVAEAKEALETIAGDYGRHSAAARRIAREFLDSRRVLREVLAQVGVS